MIQALYEQVVPTLPDDAIAVEIGSFWGRSAIWFAQAAIRANKPFNVFCVDCWDQISTPGHASAQWETRHHTDGALARFLQKVTAAGVRDRIIPVPAPSTEAAHHFPLASIDFAFIDAAHDRVSVEADVRAWLPRMKPGGLLAGHDWGRFGVIEGVHAVLPSVVEGPQWCWQYRLPESP